MAIAGEGVTTLLSVVIPVKPPEPFLQQLLQDLATVFKGEEVEYLIQYEKGLGYAVQCGVARSHGDLVAVMDADGSHRPQDLRDMVVFCSLPSVDVVVGSKNAQGSVNCDSFSRHLVSRGFNWWTRLMLGLSLNDSMSGFIVAKRKVLEGETLHKGYKFMLNIYMEGGLRIIEYPITFRRRQAGEHVPPFKEGIRTVWHVLSLWGRTHGL